MNPAVYAIGGGFGMGLSLLRQGLVTAAVGALVGGALMYLLQMWRLDRPTMEGVLAGRHPLADKTAKPKP